MGAVSHAPAAGVETAGPASCATLAQGCIVEKGTRAMARLLCEIATLESACLPPAMMMISRLVKDQLTWCPDLPM